jgi:hypothetical protein
VIHILAATATYTRMPASTEPALLDWSGPHKLGDAVFSAEVLTPPFARMSPGVAVYDLAIPALRKRRLPNRSRSTARPIIHHRLRAGTAVGVVYV